MNCDSCGSRPVGRIALRLCDVCAAEQNRLGSDKPAEAKLGEKQISVDEVRGYLREIPELLALAPSFIEPGSTPPDPDSNQKKKRSDEPSRPPLRAAVLDLTDTRYKDWSDDPAAALSDSLATPHDEFRIGAAPWLACWVMLVRGELIDLGRATERSDSETVTDDCEWLSRHTPDTVALHPEFPKLIKKLHHNLQQAVGATQPKPKLYCLKEGCGWPVVPGDTTGSWYKCTGCGKSWPRLELHRMRPRTLAELSEESGVHVRTLQRWVKAREIRPVSVNPDGDRLFRPHELRDEAFRRNVSWTRK